jgi:GT2 family glycosyltransferase
VTRADFSDSLKKISSKSRAEASMSKLKFSVIIPTCRRLDLLARCLESLAPGAQLADFNSYEVIVTDDARGETAEAMMRAQFPWAQWRQGPSRGPAANRNNGAHHATGEWLCFTDDDCAASRQWLSALVEATDDPSIDLIEGQTTVPDKPDNPFLHGIANTKGGIFWTCNLAVRRERFIELGGFDEDFLEAAAEDMEFAHRFHAHHFHSKFYPDALVYHPVRRVGWRALWNRLLMIRWSALYAYKVDEGLHLSDSPAKNVLRAFKDTILNHLRRTLREIRRWNAPYWKDRWFTCALRWVTFPVILPYYLCWVYRFHRQLTAKQPGVETQAG